ncbi:MAG: hypothetical protein J0I33_07680 [Microbacterium ginsengisoli]|jgi:hypothetical protein|uniref:hypothetical protein n=1 Tax=Microbacterium TaxID=33882 RepID=UPI000701F3EB|nr:MULTISPECIES: hypothetical protein [unclassified Microbacterium]KQR97679.1 hypothetical protein ASF93_13195 [Microbacterium sp. Leaf347]KQS01704.1 hypothetical protein ASG00_09710 [Microbacterium sp. Leaf351]MBN9198504.1 hypothetical protein [Microbacterium ginsengisoli]OJU78110.1 MAG: hypothetical protein BGO15_02605 [Microbacterium sp. 71-23]
MPEPINLRVPKSMHPDDVVWAFRYGVAWARYSVLGDASAIRRHGLAYTNHYRNVHALADRVRVAAIRRLRDRVAQQPTDPSPTEETR